MYGGDRCLKTKIDRTLEPKWLLRSLRTCLGDLGSHARVLESHARVLGSHARVLGSNARVLGSHA